MTTRRPASERITEEVTSWPGVEAGPGPGASSPSGVGRREIGHLHGDRAAHFSFPKEVWAELFARGPDRLPPGLPRQRGPGGPADRRRRGRART